MIALLILSLAGAAPATVEPPADDIVVTASTGYPGVRIPDRELAALRGGFRLPSGIDVRIVVQSETSLDGGLLLRSIYRIDTGAPTLSLFAPAPGQRVETERVTGQSAGGRGVDVMFDRSTGVLFGTRNGGGGVNVTSGAWTEAGDPQPDGLQPLDLSGGPVQTAGGTVHLVGEENGHRAIINGSNIDVSHIFGQGFGTVIANMGDNRMIDTVTSISLDLSGTSPETLGSSLLRIEGITLDAMRGMIR